MQKPDVILDCFGLLCPMPMINTAKKMKELKDGEILEVMATDIGIIPDAQAWCRSTGNEYLGEEAKEGEYRVYIKKCKP